MPCTFSDCVAWLLSKEVGFLFCKTQSIIDEGLPDSTLTVDYINILLQPNPCLISIQ